MSDTVREFKPDFTEEDLGGNPFVVSLKIPVNKLVSNKYWEKENFEGERIVAPADMELEATRHTKLYVDPARRKATSLLSPRAKDLLLWVMFEVDTAKDWIWIPKQRYMDENEVKAINTYRSALTELIKNRYMQYTTVQGVFWINPHYFFNGNRVKKYPDNVVVNKSRT